ncbi:hypothetical protein HPB47_011267 [Ixodes persulcatus]|uniref:Uncharacterized protein n=1 Tax=Ixodes persulcatus TaxID=34615 RepID=A0AC60NWP8_IXOPE|nr:hypothetical protein HPB47_011267 [Ixodes persulcatus]
MTPPNRGIITITVNVEGESASAPECEARLPLQTVWAGSRVAFVATEFVAVNQGGYPVITEMPTWAPGGNPRRTPAGPGRALLPSGPRLCLARVPRARRERLPDAFVPVLFLRLRDEAAVFFGPGAAQEAVVVDTVQDGLPRTRLRTQRPDRQQEWMDGPTVYITDA